MRRSLAALVSLSLASATACGDADRAEAPGVARPTEVQVTEVRLGTELTTDGRIAEPTTDRNTEVFEPDQPFRLAIAVIGHPLAGTVGVSWTVGPQTAEVDLAGQSVADGRPVFVGLELAHVEPMPIGPHEAVVSLEGQEVGRYPFRVGPPSDAVASEVRGARLASEVTPDLHPIDPATDFEPTDRVNLSVCGDFGRRTWLEVVWQVDGQVDPEGTHALTVPTDATDVCVAFDFRPASGWPAGSHAAVLTMNGDEVGRYAFTVDRGVAPRPD